MIMADTQLTRATTDERFPIVPTAHEGKEGFQDQLQTLIYIMSIVLAVSLLTNTFTILVLRKSDAFTEIESILYRLLAVEDSLACSVSLALIIVLKVQPEMTAFVTWYCVFPLLYQTIGIVLAVNICRYVMIVKPLRFPKWITRRRIILGHTALFVASFLLSYVIKVLGSNEGKIFSVYTTLPVLFGFGVQLLTGMHIMHISVGQSRRIAAERNRFARNQHGIGPDNSNLVNPQERVRRNSFKGLRTVLMIVGSYWVGWLPMVLNFFNDNGYFYLPNWFRVCSVSSTLLNFCWNPLIFYFTNRVFRTAANDMFRSLRYKP